MACQLRTVKKTSMQDLDTFYEEDNSPLHSYSKDVYQYIKTLDKTQYTHVLYVGLFKTRQVCMHRKAPEGVFIRAKLSALCKSVHKTH